MPSQSSGPAASSLNQGAAALGVATGLWLRSLIVGDPNAPANAAAANQLQGYNLNQDAVHLAKKGDWAGALPKYRSAYSLFPDPTIRQNLAMAIYEVYNQQYDDEALRNLNEALKLSSDGSNLKVLIQQLIDRIHATQSAAAGAKVAGSVIKDNLALAAAQSRESAVGTGSSGLTFSSSVQGSGNSGGLGMRPTSPIDVGPARNAATTPVSNTAAAAGIAAASGKAAVEDADNDDATRLKAECAFDNNGTDCAKAAPVAANVSPAAMAALRADVLAGKLGPIAQKENVKNALAWYRATEVASRDDQSAVDKYTDLTKQGGPDAQDNANKLSAANAQLAIAHQDEDKARSQLASTVKQYHVNLPDDGL